MATSGPCFYLPRFGIRVAVFLFVWFLSKCGLENLSLTYTVNLERNSCNQRTPFESFLTLAYLLFMTSFYVFITSWQLFYYTCECTLFLV